eukprot:14341-Eustigmatos_ZCMA.PRE.1
MAAEINATPSCVLTAAVDWRSGEGVRWRASRGPWPSRLRSYGAWCAAPRESPASTYYMG